MFEAIGLGGGAQLVGGFIWLIAGVMIIAGGLGWFGFGVFEGSRVILLVGGAALSLIALALYFHPIYLIAVAINVAIVVLLWSDLSVGRGLA